jgi:hypothetical protein
LLGSIVLSFDRADRYGVGDVAELHGLECRRAEEARLVDLGPSGSRGAVNMHEIKALGRDAVRRLAGETRGIVVA